VPEIAEPSVHDAIEVLFAVNGIGPMGQTTFKPVDELLVAARLTEPAKL
jgi:hypothetical protein